MAIDRETELVLAYDAGRAVMTEPPERRKLSACPFPEGSDERAAWIEGFADALGEQEDLSSLRSALSEARGDE